MVKIMIVDDNKDISATLKMMMEKLQYDTEQAYNGQEFIDKVNDVKPDLVLLDVMMPGLKTKEILNKLKEVGQSNLKVILVTVVRFADEEKEAFMNEYNVVDYITKPFSPIDLIKRVKSHV